MTSSRHAPNLSITERKSYKNHKTTQYVNAVFLAAFIIFLIRLTIIIIEGPEIDTRLGAIAGIVVVGLLAVFSWLNFRHARRELAQLRRLSDKREIDPDARAN